MKKTLHYNYYFFPVLLLTISGITNSLYLASSHYRNYTNIDYASFCAISQMFNCDTVAQSSWSVLFGMPIALWGLAGYLFYFSILINVAKYTKEKFPLWTLLQILGFIYSIIAIFLAYISAKKIHSYCPMCILNYGISFLLFLYPWIIRRRFDKSNLIANIKETLPVINKIFSLKLSITLLLILIAGTQFFLPHYWIQMSPEHSSYVKTGFTEDGHPWIGSQNPKLTIDEFTDYQCFQCGKLHSFLRKLVEKYPEKIKLIHHNYPLDHRYNPILSGKPFHIGSGDMALLAIYASNRKKFWEMNDELYNYMRTRHSKSLDLETLGKKLSLPVEELKAALVSPLFLNKLLLDIKYGVESGITATPAYIINGHVFIGSIPYSTLQSLKH